MKMNPISYHDYLKIDDLLDCQHLRSEQNKTPAHDEHLFIIVHQCYELWFKQIIREVDSAITIMNSDQVNEKSLGLVVSRLERIHEIQKVLSQQIDVMETMTPMDFLEFRDLLLPASGFQSFQFRMFENKIGLSPDTRIDYNSEHYSKHFNETLKEKLQTSEGQPNLFSSVQKWLERTPFLEDKDFNFWHSYRDSAGNMFINEKSLINENPLLNDESKLANFKIIENAEKVFSSLFNEKSFSESQEKGHWRLSHKAILAALFIHLYRDMPILHIPYRLLAKLKDIDEALTFWRYRHSLMARRMLGTKIGTGGSSGAKYLRESTEQHKIFQDFFQLTTFFIPRSELPTLPKEIQNKLDFYYKN